VTVNTWSISCDRDFKCVASPKTRIQKCKGITWSYSTNQSWIFSVVQLIKPLQIHWGCGNKLSVIVRVWGRQQKCSQTLRGVISPKKWGYHFPSPLLPSLPFRSRALNGARESEGVLQDTPAGYGAEPQPPTHFCTISAPKIASCSA